MTEYVKAVMNHHHDQSRFDDEATNVGDILSMNDPNDFFRRKFF